VAPRAHASGASHGGVRAAPRLARRGLVAEHREDRPRARKLSVYARARVSHVWLVDPLLTTIEVLRLDGDTFRIVKVHAGDESARLEPFEAIELEVGALWLKG
jgi:hypothetical protein